MLGRSVMVKELIHRGADATHSLHSRVDAGDRESVRVLLNAGIDIEGRDDDDETPLFTSIRRGNLEMTQFLLDRGARIVASNHEKSTSLHVAATLGHPDIVRELIHRGADTTAMDEDDHTAFGLVDYENDPQVSRPFLEHYGETILEEEGRLAVHCILQDADYEVLETDQRLLMRLELGRLSVEEIQILLEYLSKQNPCLLLEKGSHGRCSLQVACLYEAPVEVLRILLEQGPVVILSRNNDGELPLHVACRSEASLEVVEVVIKQFAAAILDRDGAGCLPLHAACSSKHPNLQVIHYLIERGGAGTVGARNSYGFLPLHALATSNPTRDVIESLVQMRPASLSTRTLGGQYPVTLAASRSAPLGVIYDLLRLSPGILPGE